MKQNTLEPAYPEVHSMPKRQRESRRDDTPTGRQETKDRQTPRNKGTVEVFKYCGHHIPHKGRCQVRGATCHKCKKKGHFLWFVSLKHTNNTTNQLNNFNNRQVVRMKKLYFKSFKLLYV